MASMETELYVAQLQLGEVQERLAVIGDAKLALKLQLEGEELAESTSIEEQWWQEQAAALAAYIGSLEADQKNRAAADRLQQKEQATLQASLQLAESLLAQDNYNNRIIQHDKAVAMEVDLWSDEEWEHRGEHIGRPLQLHTARPATPECAVNLVSDDSDEMSTTTAGATTAEKGKQPLQRPQAAEPSGASAGASSECSICFERFPVNRMLAAALHEQLASSSAAAGTCGHFFCRGCMRQYVQAAVKERKYPITCPNPSCKEMLDTRDAASLLQDCRQELQLFEMLVLESSIDSTQRAYCPYKDCSCLLARGEEEQPGQGQDAPFECPACNRVFCLSCVITGWHQGMSCSQFQALPPELRSVEDAAMLRMAAANAWKRCPAAGCGHIVERTEGCNHMRCRCGVDFCYACGSQYRSAATAANERGTPGCNCPLFTVPAEPDEAPPAAAAAVVPRVLRQVGLDGRPWRNGRKVRLFVCRCLARLAIILSPSLTARGAQTGAGSPTLRMRSRQQGRRNEAADDAAQMAAPHQAAPGVFMYDQLHEYCVAEDAVERAAAERAAAVRAQQAAVELMYCLHYDDDHYSDDDHMY